MAAGTVITGSAPPTESGLALFTRALGQARRPVLVAGGMPDGSRLADAVARLAEAGVPVLAEPTSQLRRRGTVGCYEALLRDPSWAGGHRPDLGPKTR